MLNKYKYIKKIRLPVLRNGPIVTYRWVFEDYHLTKPVREYVEYKMVNMETGRTKFGLYFRGKLMETEKYTLTKQGKYVFDSWMVICGNTFGRTKHKRPDNKEYTPISAKQTYTTGTTDKKQTIEIDEDGKVITAVGIKKSSYPEGKVVYKAARDIKGRPCMVTLIVPKDAKMRGSMTNVGKLRTDKAYVKDIQLIKVVRDSAIEEMEQINQAHSYVRKTKKPFVYYRETWINIDNFKDSDLVCRPGIHFCLNPSQLVEFFKMRCFSSNKKLSNAKPEGLSNIKENTVRKRTSKSNSKSSTSSSSDSSEKLSNKKEDTPVFTNVTECIVCTENKPNMIVLPCGHVSLCSDCSVEYKTKFKTCPECRTPIKEITKYVSKKEKTD
jgi:hypothetical protein